MRSQRHGGFSLEVLASNLDEHGYHDILRRTVPVTTDHTAYLDTLSHSAATCGYSRSLGTTIKQGLPSNRLLHGWLPLTSVNGAACSTTHDNFTSQ